MMPTDLLGEAVESFSGYARSYMVGLANVLVNVEQCFSFVFALCDILLRLSSPGKLPAVCVSSKPSTSFGCSCDLGFAQKNHSFEFFEKNNRENNFFRRHTVSRLVILLITLGVTIQKFTAPMRILPDCGWLYLSFEMTKFSFSLNFV